MPRKTGSGWMPPVVTTRLLSRAVREQVADESEGYWDQSPYYEDGGEKPVHHEPETTMTDQEIDIALAPVENAVRVEFGTRLC